MQIVCPQCQYAKELDDAAVPADMVYATCPQCRLRFRFREDAAGEFALEAPSDHEAASAAPGAVSEAAAEGFVSRVNSRIFATRQGGTTPEQDGSSGQAYFAGASELFAADGAGMQGQPSLPNIPWARRNEIGWLAAFIATVQEVLFSAADFFPRVGSDWKRTGALSFFTLCAMFGFFVSQVWAWAIVTFLGDTLSAESLAAFGGNFMGWGPTLVMTVAFIALAPLLQFISAGIVHAGLKMTGGAHASFGVTFNVCAFAESTTVLYVIPFIGSYVVVVWQIVVIIVGLKRVHGIAIWRVILALTMPFLLLCIAYTVWRGSYFL